jgi:hypothetical protein
VGRLGLICADRRGLVQLRVAAWSLARMLVRVWALARVRPRLRDDGRCCQSKEMMGPQIGR